MQSLSKKPPITIQPNVPDLPGCTATGSTIEETEREFREAIEFHIEGMIEDGLPVPQPTSIVQYVEITA